MCFNLVTANWLPVLRTDGVLKRVGVREALTKADDFREVWAASPLNTCAIYRFLLAALQWCKPDPSEADIAQVRKDHRFPPTWFTKLDEYSDKFELLGEEAGFYQEKVPYKNPVTYLLPELPAGTNIAHFRHTRDEYDGLCPACCAQGLIRLSAYAPSVKHGKEKQNPAGINGTAPVYVIPRGHTLLGTLLLNWPLRYVEGDVPGWMRDQPPDQDKIGCLAAMTWRPRRVYLERPKSGQHMANCASCGDKEYPLIHRIGFLPGWERPFGKEPWPQDPHLLAHVEDDGKSEKRPRSQWIGFPKPSAPAHVHATIWRSLYRAVLTALQSCRDKAGVPVGQHLQKCLNKGDTCGLMALDFFGPAANKALYQDAATLQWRLPLDKLRSDDIEEASRQLAWLDAFKPKDCLSGALPRNVDKRPEVDAALGATAAETESKLRQRFEQFVYALGGAPGGRRESVVQEWRNDVHSLLLRRLQQVVGLVASGSALQRRQQAEKVARDLEATMKRAEGGKHESEQGIRQTPS